MRYRTLEELFEAPDTLGLFEGVRPSMMKADQLSYKDKDMEQKIFHFQKTHGRLPDPESADIGEMILGTIQQIFENRDGSSS